MCSFHMFTNRAFNAAFLLSLAWHLLCMSMVSIVVLPGKYKARELTSVSFLGPILGETALEIMLVNKPVAITTRYHRTLRYTHSFDKKEKLLLKERAGDRAKKHKSAYDEGGIGRASATIFNRDKEIPNIVKRGRRQDDYPKSSSELLGSIARREVIYRPTKPKLPSRVMSSAPFTLELEFSVSAQGEIKKVVPVVSSGNPEVDLLGTRYLKGWKFAPSTHPLYEEQNGRIKFIFGGDQENL